MPKLDSSGADDVIDFSSLFDTPQTIELNSTLEVFGNGTLIINGPARSGSMTICGQIFSVTQDSGCSYAFSSSSTSVPASGITDDSFNITTNSACPWNATTFESWITLNNNSGTGTGTITFSVSENVGLTRTGTITANGQSFTVNQEAFQPTSDNARFDFDGDGKADVAVFRPANATWYINRSSDGNTDIVGFGISKDKPVMADYDGDGMDDIAIYRPGNSQWWQLRSNDSVIAYQFGITGDKAGKQRKYKAGLFNMKLALIS